MAFGRKRTEQKGEASTAKGSSATRLFLPGAALGLLLFVYQGGAFLDDGGSAVSVGAVVVSRLMADAVVGVVALCAVYIALYAVRLILAQAWGWARANLARNGTR